MKRQIGERVGDQLAKTAPEMIVDLTGPLSLPHSGTKWYKETWRAWATWLAC